jgi:hypothetical protein
MRVLKPQGHLFAVFPCLETFREGHCDILFAHRFKPGSSAQYMWLYINKKLGFGRRKKEKNAKVWAKYFQHWLEENTFYLPMKEIDAILRNNFSDLVYVEEDYIDYRLQLKYDRNFMVHNMPVIKNIARWFCRKFGSVVVLAQK